MRMSEKLQINLEEYNRLIEILVMKNSLTQRLIENLTIAEDRLENGYSIFVEYRDAKLDVSKSQLEVLRTKYDIKIAEIEIMSIIGGFLN